MLWNTGEIRNTCTLAEKYHKLILNGLPSIFSILRIMKLVSSSNMPYGPTVAALRVVFSVTALWMEMR